MANHSLQESHLEVLTKYLPGSGKPLTAGITLEGLDSYLPGSGKLITAAGTILEVLYKYLPGSGEPLTAGITHEIFDGDTPVVQVSTLLLLKQEKKTVLRLILRFNTKLVNRLSGYGIERKKQKNFHLKYFIFLKKRHLKI